eukprot:TRINITY_DN1038_c0_g2_i1.p1 TRINITY_DN1038_c0_g2~~TRINITY_DN1038_c0_g2_i1.p1  ORF type:complete len:445 (+),score=38.36 TRINITY_DN1038_c0_g2_i1:159-1493(+)
MQRLHLLLISIYIMLMASGVQSDLVILSPSAPDNSSYPIVNAVPGEWAVTSYNITGELVLVNDTGCDGYEGYNIEGKIIAVEKRGCSYGLRVKHAMEGNALAVIFLSTNNIPGQDARMPIEDDTGPFLLPGIYTGRSGDFLKDLFFNSSTVIINLTPGVNEWVVFYDSPGFIAYQAIFLGIFAGTLAIAIWKLVQVVQNAKFQFSILQVFIWVEIVNNTMRTVYFFDPFRSRGLYNIIASYLLETLHMPLTFIASMLISLYWLESVSDYISSKPTAKWLGKMSAPFYVFLGIVIALYVGFLTLAYLGNENSNSFVIAIFVMFGVAAVILIAVGAKVLSVSLKLTKSVGKTNGRNMAVRIMTIKLVFVALGMILLLSIYPSFTKIKSLNYIETQFGLNVIIFATLAIVSIAQLLTIQRRKPSKSWKSSSSSKSSYNNHIDRYINY